MLEGRKLHELIGDWAFGLATSVAISIGMALACTVLKPLAVIVSVVCALVVVAQLVVDWQNGDYDLAVADALQLTTAVSALFMKCFTGDTLVDTVEGYKRIDEIQVGDYVWAEDIVTGKKELKKVLKVYVKETDHLIHIGTSTGEDIETTETHPFYIDGRGWIAASEIKEGDKLHTADGEVVIVTYNKEEWLSETIKVYNLEVADVHTYFVTTAKVLVHNKYDADVNEKTVVNSAGKEVTRTYVKDQDALLNAAEEAAGGDLDDFIEIKPGWYENLEKTMKIEWNPEGHANTNEGPHVTVRVKNEKGSWSVVDKFFIEGWDFYK